jgi:hypothetical protein
MSGLLCAGVLYQKDTFYALVCVAYLSQLPKTSLDCFCGPALLRCCFYDTTPAAAPSARAVATVSAAFDALSPSSGPAISLPLQLLPACLAEIRETNRQPHRQPYVAIAERECVLTESCSYSPDMEAVIWVCAGQADVWQSLS